MRNEELHKVVDHAFCAPENEYRQDWWMAPLDPETPVSWGDLTYYNIPEMTITEQGIVLSDDGTICKTTGCIAGHTLMMFAPVGTRILSSKEQVVLPGEEKPREIDEYAAELLGISDEAKNYLFDACRSREQIEEAVERIDNGTFDEWYNEWE